MIVDDAPENLDLLQDILEIKGYRVAAFPGGQTALNAAVKNPPDLILLDIRMPEMNGFEVCRHLKADETLREIPVLFVSGLTATADKVKAFAAGAVDYVTKPFQCEEVLSRVATHLRLRKMQLELARHNMDLEEMVEEKAGEIIESQLATILAMSKLAESRDDETGRHIERTRSYCRVLAEALQRDPHYTTVVSGSSIDNIYHASPLHDIGKVGISDTILLKPGRLTADEFEIMKTHVVIGAKTLRAVQNRYPRNAFLNMGIAITESHHEKWDGSGYPAGLAGEHIPLGARIMAIADTYDALRSKRSYKEAHSHQESCEIILEGTGRQFDPLVIQAFVSVEDRFARIATQVNQENRTTQLY